MGSEQWLIVVNHGHGDNTPTGKLTLHAQLARNENSRCHVADGITTRDFPW